MSYKEELLQEVARAQSEIRKIIGALVGEAVALIVLLVGHLITGNLKVPLVIMFVIAFVTMIVWLYFRRTVGKLRREVRKLIDDDCH